MYFMHKSKLVFNSCLTLGIKNINIHIFMYTYINDVVMEVGFKKNVLKLKLNKGKGIRVRK